MPIRGSPNGAHHPRPQAGRDLPECQRLQIGPASQISPRVEGGTYLKPD
jgi:hypothetical protein